MSTIQKIAVYDARLQQDEPAYAVQKGALSVSVAPFQAISATSSQMTFQVLVPSLNVFVDRKIQLSTGFLFSANLLYSGPRGKSYSALGFTQLPPATATTIASTAGGLSTMTITVVVAGIIYTIGGTAVSSVASIVTPIPVGTRLVSLTATQLPDDLYIVSASANGFVYTLSRPLTTTFTGSTTIGELGLILPAYYETVDVNMGLTSTGEPGAGFTGAHHADVYLPLGYCPAVSAKDICLTQFPLQSSMINMTATLNDCTVTTNGDTLREQLVLTQTPENFKQRTTPTNVDVYAWGRDDVSNNSGNFSSYSTTNSYGDIPNGAWPIVWYSDSQCTKSLNNVAFVSTTSATAFVGYPFAAAGTASSFNIEGCASTVQALASGKSGTGWYIGAQGKPWPNASNAPNSAVIVPFVSGQPVWTTNFLGGDLLWTRSKFGGNGSSAQGTPRQGCVSFAGGFEIVNSTTLQLMQDVPPYCMIGARLYFTDVGGLPTAAPVFSGFISAIASGSLGATGSTYTICSANSDAAAGTFGTTKITLLAGVIAGAGGIGLQAGWNAYWGTMPVYGQVSVVEALVLSPYSWADSAEFQTVGLYGMTNLQFVMNFTKPSAAQAQWLGAVAPNGASSTLVTSTLPLWGDNLNIQYAGYGNILRSSNVRTIISDVEWVQAPQSQGPWVSPTLYVDFLTPGPDITLPLVSTVPYVEFPRYVSSFTNDNLKSNSVVGTQTISLTSIPDMIMVYIKPATRGPSSLDTYVPIKNVTVTFDNFSNLCSGFQQFNLYESAVAAGLPYDWHQWRGYTEGELPSIARQTLSNGAVPITYGQTPVTQLSGGPILLRMGHDITLSPGLAPGCLGNYSIQVNLLPDNRFGFFDYCNQYTITLVAINTGFFETVRGQSAIRKTILNSADVEAATPEAGMTKTHLNRMVGRGNFFSGASNLVHRGLTAARTAKKFAQDNDLTGLARTYGGHYGGMAADAADAAMNLVPSGSGMKRHRGSGL